MLPYKGCNVFTLAKDLLHLEPVAELSDGDGVVVDRILEETLHELNKLSNKKFNNCYRLDK